MANLFESSRLGSWDEPIAVTPLMPEMPIPSVQKVYVYRQRYQIRRSSWVPLALGTEHTETGAILVDESNPQNLIGGMCEWERVYALVPDTHIELESSQYTYQSEYTQPSTGKEFVIEKPRNVIIAVWHHYFYAPGTLRFNIPLYSARILTSNNNGSVSQQGGTKYTIGGGAPIIEGPTRTIELTSAGQTIRIVAEDSIVERWMGDIYVRITKTVPPL